MSETRGEVNVPKGPTRYMLMARELCMLAPMNKGIQRQLGNPKKWLTLRSEKRPGSKLGQTALRGTHRHPERDLDSSTCIPRRLILLLVLIIEMATEETKLLGEALSTVKIQVQQMKRHLVCLPIGTINTSARATTQR
jgi:hypothetical protein